MAKCCLTSKVSDTWLGPSANAEGMVPLMWLYPSNTVGPSSGLLSYPQRWLFQVNHVLVFLLYGSFYWRHATYGSGWAGYPQLGPLPGSYCHSAVLSPDLVLTDLIGAISPDFLWSTGSRRVPAAPRAQSKLVPYTSWKGSPRTEWKHPVPWRTVQVVCGPDLNKCALTPLAGFSSQILVFVMALISFKEAFRSWHPNPVHDQWAR